MNTISKSIVISLRLPPDVARAFRVEAAQRDMKLNALFEELFIDFQKRGKCSAKKKVDTNG